MWNKEAEKLYQDIREALQHAIDSAEKEEFRLTLFNLHYLEGLLAKFEEEAKSEP